MDTHDLDYELPSDLIATEPAAPRDAARLMVIHRTDEQIEHCLVRDLPDVADLRSGDVMVFNQTRVLPARFQGVRRATGGRVEGLYLHNQTGNLGNSEICWEVMLESRGKLRVGEQVLLEDDSHLELLEPLGDGRWHVGLVSPLEPFDLLARIGSTPIPPYIRKERRARHENTKPGESTRYNTVFAADSGSVAAPTAALHFTPELLRRIDQCGVKCVRLTLHIGLGTFAPVRKERLEEHQMHNEWMCVPASTCAVLRHARQIGSRIIPVGTTCVRALESLPNPLPHGADFVTQTGLFIYPPNPDHPGFPFRFTDALMTNFHLPRSTLIALVAAMPGLGLTKLKRCYQIAIEHHYRFYSYGDATLIL